MKLRSYPQIPSIKPIALKASRVKMGLGERARFGLILLTVAGCSDPKAGNTEFENACDDPSLRSEYPALASGEIFLEVPICTHVVYPNKAAYEERVASGTTTTFEGSLIDNPNKNLSGIIQVGADYFQLYYDVGVRVYNTGKVDNIFHETWGLGEDQEDMRRANNKEDCINVYVLLDTGKAYEDLDACGVGNYPGSDYPGSLIFCTTATTHEYGHNWGLYHTHEGDIEKVLEEQENCYENGDLLCESAPDPSPDECSLSLVTYPTGNFQGSVYEVSCPNYPKLEEGIPYSSVMSYYNIPYQGFGKEAGERIRCSLDQHWNQIVTDAN